MTPDELPADMEARTPAPEGEAVGDPVLWKDRPDEWTDAIIAVHPVNSTDPERHNRFALAMKMVGNRHGKYELVRLVHWLLTRLDAASPVVPAPEGEVVAWRLRRVGVVRWNLWDLDPRVDTPAYADAAEWEVQPLYASPVVPVGVSREKIARIIDPVSWEALDVYGQDKAAFIGLTTDHSLSKADAIIAALRPTDTGRE